MKIKCTKCKSEYESELGMCPYCGFEPESQRSGAAKGAKMYCSRCGKALSVDAQFCIACGAPIDVEEIHTVTDTNDKRKKKPNRMAFVLGGIAAVAVIAMILVIFLFQSRGSRDEAEKNYALYLKDEELYYTDLQEDSEAWQLTSHLIDTDDIDDEFVLAWSNSGLKYSLYMSEDGRYIFFPDKYNGGDCINLYYREVGDPNAETVKIDSDVCSYTVNSSGTLVTYIKGEEGSLYQYDIAGDSKDKIANEVSLYKVSADGTRIVFIDTGNNVYVKDNDADREKIASDITSFEDATEDLKIIYYIKDGSLYKYVDGEDKVKIATDIHQVIKVYDSGEIYYSRSKSREVSLMNYVTDDMKDSDLAVAEPPNYPYYPAANDYDTYDEYLAACEAYEAYAAKVTRDNLRESLEEEVLEYVSYALCYFDGNEETVITDAIGDYSSFAFTVAEDAPVISFETCDRFEIEKVKLSAIGSVDELKNMVEIALSSSSVRYIAVSGTATAIEQEKEIKSLEINDTGTIVYYIDEIPDGESYGELYSISIVDGIVGEPELYDDDVYIYGCYFIDDVSIRYFKDYKDSVGDLYINKNRIDYDVYEYNVSLSPDSSRIFYFTDWTSEKGCGTLKVYQNGERENIADDVYEYSVTPDGQALYLYDYNLHYYYGELYEWNDGETRKIDDEVQGL